jgi:hypothetical protein
MILLHAASDHLVAVSAGGEGDVPAGRCVAQCVIEQVAQHLSQPLTVGP